MGVRLSLTRGASAAAIAAAAGFTAPSAGHAQQGGMVGREMADLSSLAPEQEVVSLRYCDGVYSLSTAGGGLLELAEFNLRIKTDAGPMGPPQGTPALLPAGMMGDRAFVIFAAPEDISAFIERTC